jgi:hypothetical protein
MNSIADWRYNNVKHLQGALFRHAKYKAPTIDWGPRPLQWLLGKIR